MSSVEYKAFSSRRVVLIFFSAQQIVPGLGITAERTPQKIRFGEHAVLRKTNGFRKKRTGF
jgi:hypothetical protein